MQVEREPRDRARERGAKELPQDERGEGVVLYALSPLARARACAAMPSIAASGVPSCLLRLDPRRGFPRGGQSVSVQANLTIGPSC